MNMEFLCKFLGVKKEQLVQSVNDLNNIVNDMHSKVNNIEKFLKQIEENTRK